jgi:hypothetical protein
MYTMPNVPNQPEYVVLANWTLSGTDGTNTASIGGSTQFAVVEGQSGYTPYASLTQAQVIGWIQESLGPQGVANFEANVQGQINSIETPPVTPSNTALPWSN